jgi:SAM-dependent methyltransferase
VDWVQGAGEHLPFADRSFDVAVAFGNIICFAAKDGERLLRELSRVLRPGGLLLVDFSSPASAIQEFLANEANHRGLARILRRPDHYFLHRALRTGYQPYAPARLAQFEFQFYTVDEAVRALRSAGFRPVDTMSIAPLAAHHERVAAIARREPRTWRTLLELEETVGRRNGALEIGHGFAIAARRASARAPSSVGRSRSTVRPSAKRSPRVARSHPARSPTDGPASTRT